MIVAIDGPAGAGKSTVARRLAEAIGGAYLNTGAMYRAVTVLALEQGVDPTDAAGLEALAADHRIQLLNTTEGERVLADGRDITVRTRSSEVTDLVSRVAGHGGLRRRIVDQQRALIEQGDWVADGRDIGTVVAPDAEVKIFLTADPAVRAARRHSELLGQGSDVALGDVLQQITERDQTDSTRQESPLTAAPDAVVVDTSGMSVDQVTERLVEIVESVRTRGRV